MIFSIDDFLNKNTKFELVKEHFEDLEFTDELGKIIENIYGKLCPDIGISENVTEPLF